MLLIFMIMILRTFMKTLMEKESPTGEIYRPDVFLKTYKVTPYDNPSSSKSLAAAKLALVQEEYDKNPSAQKCSGTDDVTKSLTITLPYCSTVASVELCFISNRCFK
ncbi:hypothetical protein C5167_044416 [Papaver somniferum]|uniref:Uncharacterized protein n=1 Tax=Papaver somniferum TaxID=3469 RepID=A0A4Y7L8L8_PAPSO|nr:hypothetical protein C5167_044416 [Papaver somniferum]